MGKDINEVQKIINAIVDSYGEDENNWKQITKEDLRAIYQNNPNDINTEEAIKEILSWEVGNNDASLIPAMNEIKKYNVNSAKISPSVQNYFQMRKKDSYDTNRRRYNQTAGEVGDSYSENELKNVTEISEAKKIAMRDLHSNDIGKQDRAYQFYTRYFGEDELVQDLAESKKSSIKESPIKKYTNRLKSLLPTNPAQPVAGTPSAQPNQPSAIMGNIITPTARGITKVLNTAIPAIQDFNSQLTPSNLLDKGIDAYKDWRSNRQVAQQPQQPTAEPVQQSTAGTQPQQPHERAYWELQEEQGINEYNDYLKTITQQPQKSTVQTAPNPAQEVLETPSAQQTNLQNRQQTIDPYEVNAMAHSAARNPQLAAQPAQQTKEEMAAGRRSANIAAFTSPEMDALARAFFRMPPKAQEAVTKIQFPNIPDNVPPEKQAEMANQWIRQLIENGVPIKDAIELLQVI